MTTSGYDNEQSINLDFYHDAGYFSEVHLTNLSFQINYLYKYKASRILEIGKGNGFVSTFLKSSGFDITTFDINPALKPDIVGNLKELDNFFSANSFDLILCSEVLEHIPLHDLDLCLKQIHKVSKSDVLITLPSCKRYLFDIHFYMNLPKLSPLKPIFSFPFGTRKIFKDHCWELFSQKSTHPKNINSLILRYFKVSDFGRLPFNYYHYYFKIKK